MQSKNPELIIVFKKNITEEESEKIMQSWNVKYRTGMDSSKGKIYFYATGEKYVVTFGNDDDKMKFQLNRYQFLPEVHQIYEPDWDVQKD